MLLGVLGLKSTVEYMADSVPKAGVAYIRGFKSAWGPGLDANGRGGYRPQLYRSDFEFCDNCAWAAQDLALGHEIIVMALLMGIVAYLSRGKGDLQALLGEVRQSARLGPKMADWLAQNESRLRNHPMLQNRGKGEKNAALGDVSGAAGGGSTAKPVREQSNARKGVFGEVKADEFMQRSGFEKLDKQGRLAQLDDAPAGHGIDSIWKNLNPPPDYVIAEAKFGEGSMGKTLDGRQMSDDCETGLDRLRTAIGSKETNSIETSLYKRGPRITGNLYRELKI